MFMLTAIVISALSVIIDFILFAFMKKAVKQQDAKQLRRLCKILSVSLFVGIISLSVYSVLDIKTRVVNDKTLLLVIVSVLVKLSPYILIGFTVVKHFNDIADKLEKQNRD